MIVYVNADYEVTGPSQMVMPTVPPTYTHKLYLAIVTCASCNGIPPVSALPMNLAAARVTYRFNGQQVAVREGVTLTFIYGDHLGSASMTTNISGTKVSEARYYPFGETRYSSGNTATTKRFTSQEEQVGIGLYDYGARFYAPAIGRFVSADSVVPRPGDPQSLNRYAYVRNAPLTQLDPTGHDDTLADILDFFKGSSMQYSDDVTLGMQSALNADVKREFETNGSIAFTTGRQVGRIASMLQGINEAASGGGMMLGGVIGGSAIAVGGCMGTALIGCQVAAGGGLALGTVLVGAGTVEAAHGLGSAAGRPIPSTAMLSNSSPKGLTGKPFEDWVQGKLGAKPWTKNKVFDLQSADGKAAIQVKGGSGFFKQPKGDIYGYFGSQLQAAKVAGMDYEFHTNWPVPQEWKDWMTQKGIKIFEW